MRAPATPAAAGPFAVVRSFPVSEATWAEAVGDLFLVAAQRAVLVYRKTGPGIGDCREVNRIVPGVDGRIENGAVADDRLYVPASAQGLFAYRLADLERPDVQPVARYSGPQRIGAVSVAGGRVYAALAPGGLGVFDAASLRLLGTGLAEAGVGALGLTALPGGIVYTSRAPNYETLLVVDARDPAGLQVVQRLRNPEYPTLFHFPATAVGDRLYVAEHNGGVGVYDIADPAAPKLRYRHAAIGAAPPRGGGRNRPGLVRACAVAGDTAYIAVDQTVRSLHIRGDEMQPGAALVTAERQGNGLLDPQAVFVRDRVVAVTTTMEGVRFVEASDPVAPQERLRIDLPSRLEGLAKVGRMVYATADVDGVWQVDWEAPGGPRADRRIPLKGLSEDLALHANHLYVANGVGLAVVEVADAAAPREVAYWDFPYRDGKPDIQQGWVEGVDVAGNTLYAALGPAGLATFDVSAPAQPVHLATLAPGTWGNEVVVEPRRQLLAFTGQEKFALVDVHDPRQPAVLANTPVPAGRATMGSAFSPDGESLVVCQRGMFSVYDVRDPRTPRLLRSYDGCGSENALFFGGYLLVSGRGAGTGVWRVGTTPADLTHVQTLPCYFYNSKFWVEGESVFTNSEGIDELRLVTPARP
jgi:hypothetical protein